MNHMKQLIRHFCVLDCWRTFNMYHIHPTYSNIFQNEIHISYSFIFHIPYIYTVYIHSFNILMLIVFGWIGNSSIWRHKKWPSGRDLLIWKRVSVPCVVGFCVNPWPSFVLDGRSPVSDGFRSDLPWPAEVTLGSMAKSAKQRPFFAHAGQFCANLPWFSCCGIEVR